MSTSTEPTPIVYAAHPQGQAPGQSPACLILAITLLNMRGIKESGTVFAIPTYLYMFVFGGLIIYGLARSFLGDISTVSWGTNLYWAQNNAGLLVGAWWTFIPSGMSIALVAFGLSMINYGMDEITNPRLRAERDLNDVLKHSPIKIARSNIGATPVVRRTVS